MKKINISLSKHVIDKLSEAADKLSVSKEKIIEGALIAYFGDLKRGEYERLFQADLLDEYIAVMVEEGMSDYFHQTKTT
ncbi:hypothetical protein C943_03398 [Mariniradius saccharolyticus AK6]|uniref:Uncharacterized protein n=1 Tax=Mariniradius saccharolyticus AK6 TaxID=1239962 RepID=M7YC08_9BACT|nr:hypothetical protein [Mariniradius saccharolyticus]EMS34711.1 hypothetical protein C943_03398 [Mariniradius saccharolyticus AK6]